jgi:hypothetical protein
MILASVSAGASIPTIEEYVARHPALADRIRNVLSAVALIEQGRVDSTLSAEVHGSTIGRYKLLERIGEGGFGVVYMAEQQQPVRRKVALKVVKPGWTAARCWPGSTPSGRPWRSWTTRTSPRCSTAG